MRASLRDRHASRPPRTMLDCCRIGPIILLIALLSDPSDLGAQRTVDAARGTAAIGTAIVIVSVYDQDLRRAFSRQNGSLDWLSKVGNIGGRAGSPAMLMAGSAIFGHVTDRPELTRIALDASTGLAAAGIANGVLKFTVGRQRPSVGDSQWQFQPFNIDDDFQSFPSGHVTVAFGFAAGISEAAANRWVSLASYGTAGIVAWSRMYEDRHWASDVIGAAAIATVVSRKTVGWLHRDDTGSVRPIITPGGAGLTVAF